MNEHGNSPLHYACFWNLETIAVVSTPVEITASSICGYVGKSSESTILQLIYHDYTARCYFDLCYAGRRDMWETHDYVLLLILWTLLTGNSHLEGINEKLTGINEHNRLLTCNAMHCLPLFILFQIKWRYYYNNNNFSNTHLKTMHTYHYFKL